MCCGYMWKNVKIGVEKIKDLRKRRNNNEFIHKNFNSISTANYTKINS